MTIQSVCVQKRISKPINALQEFNSRSNDGTIPIVLIPKWPNLFGFFVKIPSGVYVLYQKWHAHQGLLEPGLKLAWPAYNRVSHIVTKQSVTYTAPIKECPTSDNVMINIDISINFQIGPGEDAPVKFVYKLGANQLDQLLNQQTDEAIRGLVNSVRHDQVHDLREDFAVGMKKELNETLNDFGVIVHNVKVTNVELPLDLSNALQRTTAFQTKMEEQEKKHENDKRILINNETKEITGIQKDNDRKADKLLAQKERALLHRQEGVIEAMAIVEVECTNVRSEAEALINRAKGEKDVAHSRASAEATSQRNKMEVKLNTTKIEYIQKLADATIDKDSKITSANAKAEGQMLVANAEGMASECLMMKRRFEYLSKKISTQKLLASKAKIVIAGASGESLIQGMCSNEEIRQVKPVS